MQMLLPTEARVSQERYEHIVRGFALRHLLVVGDLMIDEYLRGQVRRISPESPVMVVEVYSEDLHPGGAANVANNLCRMGAHVSLAGVIGNDEMGHALLRLLATSAVATDGVLSDANRPTTRKTRIVAQNQQVVRVDREQTHAVDDASGTRLCDYVASMLPYVDAVLVSDYRKGVVTPEVARFLVDRTRQAGKLLIANPKPESVNWLRGADLLSLNQAETESLQGPMPEEQKALADYGQALRARLEAIMLVVTRGAKGLAYWRNDGEYQSIPAHAIEVFDVAGAGDTTISALALARIGGASPTEAAIVANHAGACAVRKRGVATVSQVELIEDWRTELQTQLHVAGKE